VELNTKLTQPDDVAPLLLLKSAAPHAGRDLDAMRETAKALKERSLEMFKATLKEYTERECFPRMVGMETNFFLRFNPAILNVQNGQKRGRKHTCTWYVADMSDRTATRPSNPISPVGALRHIARAKFGPRD
jgi:hypothetical protein